MDSIAKTISQLPFSERIPALIKTGIITDVCLGVFASGIRPIVIVNMNGVKMPFYRSTGTFGKIPGVWHIFFGFGKGRVADRILDWMAKGDLTQMENYYLSPSIKYYSEIINATLNWPPHLDRSGNNEYFNPYVTGPFISLGVSKAEFNQLVFGEADRGIIRGYTAQEKIAIDVTRINMANKRPVRIQRKRIKGFKLPENTVSVARPHKWGNPFYVKFEQGAYCVKDKQGNYWGEPYVMESQAFIKALECFRGYIDGEIFMGRLNIDELRGKNLACFCSLNHACHADILLQLANQPINL